MILKADEITRRLREEIDPLVITPSPTSDAIKEGTAAVDLRLGTWFVTLRPARMPSLEIGGAREARATKTHYVRFGDRYYLHPRNFALGVTLEWIRLPKNVAGYVVGKSSWGRRGLIIATAVGVHPGFTGCLTLELANAGEMPIALEPGMRIGQLFLHETRGNPALFDQSVLSRRRKPALGTVSRDLFCERLRAVAADLPLNAGMGAFFSRVLRFVETGSVGLPDGQAEALVGFLIAKGSEGVSEPDGLLVGNFTEGTICRIGSKGLLLSIPGIYAAIQTIGIALSPLAPIAIGLGILLAIKEVRDAIDTLNDEQASVVWTLYLRARETVPAGTLGEAVGIERGTRSLPPMSDGRLDAVLAGLVKAGVVTQNAGSFALAEWFAIRPV